MIKFEIVGEDHRSQSCSAENALMIWFIHITEKTAGKRIDKFVFSDDPKTFLSQIAGCIERTYNLRVDLDRNLSFEEQCIQIMKLLFDNGCIRQLRIT